VSSTTPRIVRPFACLAVAVALAFASGACGPSGASVCDAKCECEGCSAAHYDSCVFSADGDEASSDFRGCLDLYYDYVSCEDATGFCRGTDFDTSCGAEKDRWKHCMGGFSCSGKHCK
jgi:hypothetical protein